MTGDFTDPVKKGQNPPELVRLPPTGEPRFDREVKFFSTANGEDRALPDFFAEEGVSGAFLDDDVGVASRLGSPCSAMIPTANVANVTDSLQLLNVDFAF